MKNYTCGKKACNTYTNSQPYYNFKKKKTEKSAYQLNDDLINVGPVVFDGPPKLPVVVFEEYYLVHLQLDRSRSHCKIKRKNTVLVELKFCTWG